MPDLQRARTRRQSPRISAVMAESGPRVGGGKAPIARYAMSSGSIRKQRAVEGAASGEPRGFGESKRESGPRPLEGVCQHRAHGCEGSEAVACTGG